MTEGANGYPPGMIARTALVLAALLLFVAVALGALGTHALKPHIAPDMLSVWNTAVQYHAWHALALLAAGAVLLARPDASLGIAAWLFIAGILLFSGSLYVGALTNIRGFAVLTPIGGLAFLAGWLAFAWGAWRLR